MLENIQMQQLLMQYNPWWIDGNMGEEIPEMHRRAYHETLDILQDEEIRRFVILSGARRIGKTTIMKQLIAELLSQGVPAKHILYLSFDNPMFKLLGFRRVMEAYNEFVPEQEQRFLFLDEIQYADDWSLWLKTLYDTRPQLRIVATGSASPSLEKGASDSGVGRWRVLRMPTLTFREYCDICHIDNNCKGLHYSLQDWAGMSKAQLHETMSSFGNMQAAWTHYLAQGGFPELIQVSSAARAQVLLREDVADKVLKRDVPSLFDVRNTLQLEKIFIYLCLHSGSAINMAAMCRELEGVTLPTLQRYIEYLRDANLIYICENSTNSGKKGLSAQSKIYVADSALRNAMLMQAPEFLSDTEMGSIVEGVVYKHLLHAYGTTHRVGYLQLKGRQKAEVDFAVIHPTGKRFLCEVKYKNDSSITQKDGIVEAMKQKETSGAFLITRNLNDFGISHMADAELPLIRIPAAAFCYLTSDLIH